MTSDPRDSPASASPEGHQDAGERPSPPSDRAVSVGMDGDRHLVGDALRATGSALFGRDLLAPRPSLVPWGRRARESRHRRREILNRARERRTQVWREFTTPPDPPRAEEPRSWRPVPPRRHAAVAVGLIMIVGAVFVLAMRYGDRPPTASRSPVDTTVATGPTMTLASPPPTVSTPPAASRVSSAPLLPIPSGGVSPLTPPASTALDPASIVLVAPPAGDATASELGTPDGAVRAWLARTCPFDWHDPLGAAEARGRSALTQAGWRQVDPTGNPAARTSWAETVAARETGRCAAPVAMVDPEAPRTDTAAIVIGSIARVVTGPGAPPYVDTVDWTGWVRLGPDGLWRVDLASPGG